jgi:hypothetical protein
MDSRKWAIYLINDVPPHIYENIKEYKSMRCIYPEGDIAEWVSIGKSDGAPSIFPVPGGG